MYPLQPQKIPDFGTLRKKLARFAAQLRHHVEQEQDIVVESVNTDIGVGD